MPLILVVAFIILVSLSLPIASSVQILSKSKLEKCEKVSDSGSLNCSKRILVDMAVPSEAVSILIFVDFVDFTLVYWKWKISLLYIEKQISAIHYGILRVFK